MPIRAAQHECAGLAADPADGVEGQIQAPAHGHHGFTVVGRGGEQQLVVVPAAEQAASSQSRISTGGKEGGQRESRFVHEGTHRGLLENVPQVSQQAGMPVDSATCAADLQPMVNAVTSCTLVTKNKPMDVTVTVTNVSGGLIKYSIKRA